jgi:hypothetical protein
VKRGQILILLVKAMMPLFVFKSSYAQIVFCPPGASWNYSFVYIPAPNGIYNYVNEQIAYVKDSLIGGEPAKVLTHRFYYEQCYQVGQLQPKETYIKQRGDTVFFRNARTQHTWQILYNFASPPGGSWKTTLLDAYDIPYTTTLTVDSISQEVKNGFNLKKLHLDIGV